MLILAALVALSLTVLLIAGMLFARWALVGDVQERRLGLTALLRRLARPVTPRWIWRGPLLLTYRRDRLGRFRKLVR
jgi:hypothetical protein